MVHGHFVHCVFAPAIEVGGRRYPGLSNAAPYSSVGTLLFVSTAAHRMTEYEIYHSYVEYSMGPFDHQWEYVGTVWSYLGHTEDEVTMESMQRVAGVMYTERYAFGDINGGVDVYVRGSKSSFPHRYAHYKLGVDDPVHFWRAESYKFVNRVVWPFWMYHRSVRR